MEDPPRFEARKWYFFVPRLRAQTCFIDLIADQWCTFEDAWCVGEIRRPPFRFYLMQGRALGEGADASAPERLFIIEHSDDLHS